MRRKLFLIILVFCVGYSNVYANVYLDKILEFLTGNKARQSNFSARDILNITTDKENKRNHPKSADIETATSSGRSAMSTSRNVPNLQGYLKDIFQSPGISPNLTSNPSASGANPVNGSAPAETPSAQTQPSFLQGLMSGITQRPPNSPAQSTQTPDQGNSFSSLQSTPNPDQGNSLPAGQTSGECNIPKGPIAYNIGGNSVSCKAATIVAGFKQPLRSGAFGAGYINPLLERGMSASGASAGNCRGNTASQYGEKCFTDYSSGSALAYIQSQVLHWQQQGVLKGQKCVPVDIDNCDSIGSKNYLEILNYIEKVNNQGSVKIKVLSKNPHLGGCNFFSHPAVVGAFIEEISPAEAQKVSKMRTRADQILLFARGGSGSNKKLKQIEALKIPNSSYSYDAGSEYEKIIDCTYNP